jgi:NodT family efflux transporter outer membrane factor (OMF) lipoprotein
VRAGLDTNVELFGAEGGVARVAVEREQARLAQEAAVHALAALTGRGAEAYPTFEPPTLDFEQALDLPQLLPADLLAHRPDVAAARARVQAATSSREAAVASFYPNVNLYAFIGMQAIGLDELLDYGSRAWSVGPAIHLPLFDGGRLAADYHRAGADADAAVSAYNETVLQAVREVADQLARVGSLERQLADQRRALESYEGAYRLAEQRYGAGLANYLTVLNAETQVLEARRQRVNLLSDRALARVALLVALGGDFQEPAR